MLTVCSLLITLILMASSRQHRKWPPSHKLVKASRAFNRTVCCHYVCATITRLLTPQIASDALSRAMQYSVQYTTLTPANETVDTPRVTATPASAPAAVDTSQPLDFNNEWLEIFVAANNWASLCTISVYLLGAMIILW